MKNYFFLWLLLLFLVPVANAITNPYLMTHEKFVHLGQLEKQTLIIKTMEMMVELEEKYSKEMKVTGQNSERLKSYAKLLKQLRNFLLSEAVAADDFTKLLKSHAGDACIYGGWVSKVYRDKKSGSVYCLHPAESGDEAIKKAYQASKSCHSPEYISCNPMVFGYKKSKEKSLFCIDNRMTADLKRNRAHNVSYECMSAALKENPDPKIQDSKDDRLKAMSLEMSSNSNKEAFNSVHKYIFQTCACGKADEMDNTYRLYILPHRTCYGMMKTLKAIGEHNCTPMITLPTDQQAFIDKWNTFFDKKFDPLTVPPSKLPQSKLEDEYKILLHDPTLLKYCEGGKPEAKNCTISVTDVNGNKNQSLATISIPGVDIKNVEIKWPTGGTSNSDRPDQAVYDKKSAGVKLDLNLYLKSDKSKAFSCSTEIPALEPVKVEKKCSISVADLADNQDKTLAIIKFEGVKENEVDFKWPEGAGLIPDKIAEATFDKKGEPQKFEIKVTLKADSKNPISCPLEIPAKIVAPAQKNCTISVADLADDTNNSTATIAFTGIEADKVNFSWPTGSLPTKENPLQAIFKKQKDPQNIELTVAVKADAKSTFKCPAIIPALDAPRLAESCVVTVNDVKEDPTKKSLAVVEFKGVKEGDAEFSWPSGGETSSEKPKEAIYEKKEAEQKFEISATLKSDKAKKIACPLNIPALGKSDEPKSIYKIEAKAEAYKDQDTTIPIKAIIKNDKGEEVSLPPGHKISWTRSGAGVSKIKEVKKEKQDNGTVADNQDAATAEVKPLVAGEFSTEASISAPRVEADYKVTAHLIDDKGADVAQDDEAVPLLKAKETPRPNNNQNNSGGPPRQAPVFQLTPFNTSTQGVQ